MYIFNLCIFNNLITHFLMQFSLKPLIYIFDTVRCRNKGIETFSLRKIIKLDHIHI